MSDYVWRVIKREGGYSNRSSDRGGRTFRGITWLLYTRYCKRVGATPDPAHHRNLSEEEVFAIYTVMFIQPSRIEEYKSDWVREAMFSSCIMHGSGSAAILAQRAANFLAIHKLKLDGVAGSRTIKEINDQEPIRFVNSLTKERIIFVDRLVQRTVSKGDVSQVDNLVGWHNRFLLFIKP